MSGPFDGITFPTSRWRIAVLRLIFPRRDAVKVRGTIYLLRLPEEPT